MELISYAEAAQLLDISVGTLKEALKPQRNILTKVRRANSPLLVKEQVMLFAGINPRTGNKKRLSLRALTPNERELWQQYADRAQAMMHPVPIVDEEIIQRVADERLSEKTEEIKDNIIDQIIIALGGQPSPKKQLAVAH